MRSWRSIVLWITGGVSGFALLYVIFAHLFAASHRMSPDARDFGDGFGDPAAFASTYTVRKHGELSHALRGGALVVEGGGKTGDEILFATSSRRYDDGVVTLRFRAPDTDAVETFLGFEQTGTGRTVTAGFVGGAAPFVRIGGDVSGPLRAGTGSQDARVEAAPGEWHTLAVQFTPVHGMISAALDGRPLLGVHAGWFQGTEARIVFGARLRSDTPKVSVELDGLEMHTLDWAILKSFDETFSGEFVDVKRWSFELPQPDLGTTDVHIEKGKGLLVDAKMRGIIVDPSFIFLIKTFPFPLHGFRIAAELTVEDLEDATLFVGLMGASAWTSADRVFDVGVVRHKAEASVFAAGAWNANGGLAFDRGAEVALPHRLSCELRYDAATGMGQATIDGKAYDPHLLDLKALDIVSVRIGAIGHSAGAKARLHVHRIAVEMR
ncbi:MAG: hypothetical protein KF819_26720 [Labilithrix sp.]|nr:hypothetical protein [Labilithrix sp.]